MEIIGHEAILRFLAAVRGQGTVAHAYLFVGPSSVGKTAVAASFLSELLSLPPVQTGAADPWASLRVQPDVVILERETDPKTEKKKKNISIEQVRGLRERLMMSTFLPSWKVGVITEAETLSEEAANALLKTLEEPTEKTLLLLIAHSLWSVPATVRSRCQLVRFSLVPELELQEGLIRRGLPTETAAELARRSRGRPGAAIAEMADPTLAAAARRAEESFARVLAEPVWSKLKFADAAAPEREAASARDQALQTLDCWESVLGDALRAAAGLTSLGGPRLRDSLGPWLAKKSLADILSAISAISEAKGAISENVSPRLALARALLAA